MNYPETLPRKATQKSKPTRETERTALAIQQGTATAEQQPIRRSTGK